MPILGFRTDSMRSGHGYSSDVVSLRRAAQHRNGADAFDGPRAIMAPWRAAHFAR